MKRPSHKNGPTKKHTKLRRRLRHGGQRHVPPPPKANVQPGTCASTRRFGSPQTRRTAEGIGLHLCRASERTRPLPATSTAPGFLSDHTSFQGSIGSSPPAPAAHISRSLRGGWAARNAPPFSAQVRCGARAGRVWRLYSTATTKIRREIMHNSAGMYRPEWRIYHRHSVIRAVLFAFSLVA